MCSAQVGKTETFILNPLGFHIAHDPAPILIVMPSLDVAEAWSKERLAPMLEETPALKGLVKSPRAKASENNIKNKSFPGGHLAIVGANSAAGLASRPIRIVFLDEVDKFPESAGTEGDPVSLARKRTTTFFNRKIVMVSTPNIKGTSRIESAYLESDQQKYFVPCPHCDEFQILKWGNVEWDKPDGEHKPETAHYVCGHCGTCLYESDKPRMLSRGEWRATSESKGVAGFWINELYSPWVKWPEMAEDYLEKRKNPEDLKTFINSSLGETWEEFRDKKSWESVREKCRPYQSGEVPQEAKILTCGVDVQKNRLVYVVRAWGKDSESWLVEAGELWGETSKPEVWEQLDGLLDKDFGGHNIRMMAIDSGYESSMVYEFCTRHRGQAIPTKGNESLSKSYFLKDIVKKSSLKLLSFAPDVFKSWVVSRMEWPVDRPGGWWLPADITDDYCKQVTAEQKILKPSGFVKWVQVRKDNHFFDAEVMNYLLIKFRFESFLKEKKKVKRPIQEPKEKHSFVRRQKGFVRGGRR